MDFARDETQEDVAGVAADLLARDLGADELWRAMAEADLLSLALPERLGGSALGVAEAATVLTEVGRSAARIPALPTIGFGVLPVLALATEAQQDVLLDGVPGGAVLSAALAEPGRPFPGRPGATVTATDGGHAVTGSFVAVPYADRARFVLVPTDAGVVAVDPNAEGVTLRESPSAVGDPEFSMRLDGAVGTLLGDGLDGAESVATLYRLAIAATAAYSDGLLSGATDLTARHVSERHQFGKPLATFQAVAQQIADVYVTARTLHVAALSSVWRVSRGSRRRRRSRRHRVLDRCGTSSRHAGVAPPARRHRSGRRPIRCTDTRRPPRILHGWLGGASYRLDLVGARCSSI